MSTSVPSASAVPTPPTTEPSAQAPALSRRLAAFMYEGVLMFGLTVVAGLIYSYITQQRNGLQGRTGLQIFLFSVMGLYFTWFWTHGGQTLAMQTWKIRLRNGRNANLSWPQAWIRYLSCWVWVLPPLLISECVHWDSSLKISLTTIAWILSYALLAKLQKHHQFWHDALCKTRIINAR